MQNFVSSENVFFCLEQSEPKKMNIHFLYSKNKFSADNSINNTQNFLSESPKRIWMRKRLQLKVHLKKLMDLINYILHNS